MITVGEGDGGVSGVETTTYAVTGMTCGHCVSAVTQELGEVAGVREVQVALDPRGTSTVTVSSDGPLDDAAARAAVEEAGYAVAP